MVSTFNITPDANYRIADVRVDGASIGTPSSCTLANITANHTIVAYMVEASNPPVAYDQAVSLNKNTAKEINLVATDKDNDALSYSIVAYPSNGSLIGSGANITYKPNYNYVGPDSFTFKANDGRFDSNIAIVNIKVASPKRR